MNVKRTLLSTLLVLVLALVASPSRAGGPRARELPLTTDRPVAIAAASAPDALRTLGTAYLAWVETSVSDSEVWVGEWDLSGGRFLQKRIVRKRSDQCAVQVARSGGRVVVVVAGRSDSLEPSPVEVASLDASDLHEQASSTWGAGFAPSLVADDDHVLVGVFEEKTPVMPRQVFRDTTWQPHHALHVRVVVPETLQIVGARLFRGDRLLTPWLAVDAAGYALALRGRRAYVALPSTDATLLAVSVPGLATESRVTLAPGSRHISQGRSRVLTLTDDRLVVSGDDDVQVFTPDLRVVAQGTAGGTFFGHAPGSPVLYTGAGSGGRLGGWDIRVVDGGTPRFAVVGRRVVAVAQVQDDLGTPTSSWAVTVLR